MKLPFPISQHPRRVALHNEIHARPPEALQAPLVISHLVMACDAREREASREHLAALLRNHHQGKPIPFGPYLAIAGWITLLWGDSITRWNLDVVL